MAGISISPGERSDLDRLEPLWLELLEHHRHASGALPFRAAEVSWPLRRRAYERWLTDGGMLMLAGMDGSLHGYAFVSIGGPDETWDLGAVTAELQSLVITEHARGCGIGTALVDAVERELASRAIQHLLVGVVHTNTDATRFYRRYGWTPCYMLMHRRITDSTCEGRS